MQKVVVGGTFDSFHKGHREFLNKAISLGSVKIGLTSDKMALQTKGPGVESYEERKSHLLENFPQVEVEKIEEPLGFALDEDFDYIVVSTETKPRAEKINEEREKEGKQRIKIEEVELVLADDGQPISSTRIRAGEIDKEGGVLK
jgi:pantetheine-phosphate adenylyltransferase